MKQVLIVTRTPTAYRWQRVDRDAGEQLLEESGDYPTWQEARSAATLAYPGITEIQVNAVRDTGIEYEDSLPSRYLQGNSRQWWEVLKP